MKAPQRPTLAEEVAAIPRPVAVLLAVGWALGAAELLKAAAVAVLGFWR